MLARAGGVAWPRRETEQKPTNFKHKLEEQNWSLRVEEAGDKQELQWVGQSAPTQFQFDPLP